MRARLILVVATAVLAAACSGDSKDVLDGAVDGESTDATVDPQDSVVVFDTATPVDTTVVSDTAVVADTAEPPKPGEFGYTCERNEDCNSGWCIQTSQGRQCTRTCQSECPPFYDCREAPGTDATFICLQRFQNLCDPCKEAADCNGAGEVGNYCLSYGEKGRFCGGACRGDDDCPSSYVCRNVPIGGGGEANQCVPADGAQCKCSPLATALQKATICFQESDLGRCEGTRFCTQSGLNVCDAPAPLPESCNKRDDNCNGAVDEFPPDYLCYIENEFGTCPGRGQCTEGVETCAGEPPRPEQCNGLDDDCDGHTDEDLCDDGNICTIDSCDSDGNCQHAADNTKLCDDGSVCTQVDKCVDGACRGYNPLQCGDANPCFSWQCDPVAGCLSDYDNTKACEDGQPCTKGDMCNQGVCVPGNWDQCDDGNACTTDSCVAGQGCRHDPVANASPCGGQSGQCTVGQCVNGQCLGIATNEGQTCTAGGLGSCQRAVCRSGACTAESINSSPSNPTICNLSGECTTGYCATGVCRPLADVTCQAEVDVGFCSTDVPGKCTSAGQCVPTQQGNQCNCGSCSSFCATLCAGLCICMDFLFN